MLAQTATEPFDSAKHLFEPSWGGERALAFIEIRPTATRSAWSTGRAATSPPSCRSWPTCRPGSSPGPPCSTGSSWWSTPPVEPTPRASPPASAEDGPAVSYLVFDLLVLDGRQLIGEALVKRRQALRRTLTPGDMVVAVPAIVGEGLALHAAVRAQGIAATVARVLGAPYLPGVRSRLWLRVEATPADAGTDLSRHSAWSPPRRSSRAARSWPSSAASAGVGLSGRPVAAVGRSPTSSARSARERTLRPWPPRPRLPPARPPPTPRPPVPADLRPAAGRLVGRRRDPHRHRPGVPRRPGRPPGRRLHRPRHRPDVPCGVRVTREYGFLVPGGIVTGVGPASSSRRTCRASRAARCSCWPRLRVRGDLGHRPGVPRPREPSRGR